MNAFHRWFCRTAFWGRTLEGELIPWALENLELGEDVLELGSGPGLATEILRRRFARVTAIEYNPALAARLRDSICAANVSVHEADATAMPFPDRSFSGVVCFTMLHHVPTPALQDQLFAEACRVLRPGGAFAGTDSRTSVPLRLVHWGDTLVPVEPETLDQRLRAAGFDQVEVTAGRRTFRFRARRPAL